MDAGSVRALNALNRAFYRLTAAHFDESRGRDWPGWRRLAPILTALPQPIRVLDVGCGNGRFGRFLARTLAVPPRYHGIDHTPELLEAARAAFAVMGVLPDAVLEERDIVERPPDSGVYDFVGLFGVIHHVPGSAQRRALMAALAERVGPGGVLAFASWRFMDHARFRERITAWPDGITQEAGDYVLDWRRGQAALRYCHHVDDAEQAALEAATGLTLVERFAADGHTGNINCYSVLRRPSA
jgi:SAM-dependent methyltransferase